MFCYQCEQAAKGEGCTVQGVCGKNPEVAALQDLLIYSLQGLSLVAVAGRKVGVSDHDVNVFTCEAAFSTLTNVDFDPDRLITLIKKSVELREQLIAKVTKAGGKVDMGAGPVTMKPEANLEGLLKQAESVGLKSYPAADADILALKHTLLFGIKGVCAYADHARILGQEDDKVYAFIHEGLAATAAKDLGLDEVLGLVLKCGEINLRTMELLDAANTGRYGHPVPTKVPLGHKKGQGHPGFRARSPGFGRDPETERRERYLRLHPRRDAALPWLSRPQEVSPFLRPLRHRLAEPGQGISPVSRRHRHDHQLHPAAPGSLCP